MKIYFFILMLLFSGFGLFGQESEGEEYEEEGEEEYYEESIEDYTPMFSLGLEFDVGIPQGNFRNNLDRVAFGFGGYFLVRTNPTSNVPVLAGLSGKVTIYDSESQNQVILIDGATIDGRLITRNSIFMGHGILRIIPPVDFPIQPYIDGMFGLKNLYTRTTLEDRSNFGEGEAIESYIEQGDWALSYGGAIGFQYLIGGNDNIYILLEARCSYLRGNAADYLVRIDDPNIQITDTIDAFEEKNSTTDMLIPQLGVSFVF